MRRRRSAFAETLFAISDKDDEAEAMAQVKSWFRRAGGFKTASQADPYDKQQTVFLGQLPQILAAGTALHLVWAMTSTTGINWPVGRASTKQSPSCWSILFGLLTRQSAPFGALGPGTNWPRLCAQPSLPPFARHSECLLSRPMSGSKSHMIRSSTLRSHWPPPISGSEWASNLKGTNARCWTPERSGCCAALRLAGPSFRRPCRLKCSRLPGDIAPH